MLRTSNPPRDAGRAPSASDFGPWARARSWARAWWREHEWTVVALVALGSLGLGCAGFVALDPQGPRHSVLDIFYRSLQLFVLESGAVSPPVPIALEVARFTSPLVAIYTAVQAIAQVFGEQLGLFRLRFHRRHAVICGLGEIGSRVAAAFAAERYRVVAVERDATNPSIERCRDRGVNVVIGDASVAETLRRARVDRARFLVAACGDDATNTSIVTVAQDLAPTQRTDPLTCVAQVTALTTYHALRRREIAAGQPDSLRLDFFHLYETGAQALLDDRPAFTAQVASASGAHHVLLSGLDDLAECMIVNLAKRWHAATASEPAANVRQPAALRITVADSGVKDVLARLRSRHPALGTLVDLHPLPIVSSGGAVRDELAALVRDRPLTAVYARVDGRHDASAQRSLELVEALRDATIPITLVTLGPSGLAKLLADPGRGDFRDLATFSILERACSLGRVLGGTHEILARALHESYRRSLGQRGRVAPGPNVVRWDALPEVKKESNRLQSDHLGAKLDRAGCVIEPLEDITEPLFVFDDQTVDGLARAEHERWLAEQRALGIHWGPERTRKAHPAVVPWTELPEEHRETNRALVRAIPIALANAGYRIRQRAAADPRSGKPDDDLPRGGRGR